MTKTEFKIIEEFYYDAYYDFLTAKDAHSLESASSVLLSFQRLCDDLCLDMHVAEARAILSSHNQISDDIATVA